MDVHDRDSESAPRRCVLSHINCTCWGWLRDSIELVNNLSKFARAQIRASSRRAETPRSTAEMCSFIWQHDQGTMNTLHD